MRELTERQLDVLAQVRRGHSDKAIAHNLGICERTVKSHLQALRKRLGAHNRIQLAIKGQELNFPEVPAGATIDLLNAAARLLRTAGYTVSEPNSR